MNHAVSLRTYRKIFSPNCSLAACQFATQKHEKTNGKNLAFPYILKRNLSTIYLRQVSIVAKFMKFYKESSTEGRLYVVHNNERENRKTILIPFVKESIKIALKKVFILTKHKPSDRFWSTSTVSESFLKLSAVKHYREKFQLKKQYLNKQDDIEYYFLIFVSEV